MESHWNDEAFVNTFYLSLSTDIKDMQTTVDLPSNFEALVELVFKNQLWEREGLCGSTEQETSQCYGSQRHQFSLPSLLNNTVQDQYFGLCIRALRSNSFDNMGDIASILEAWDILWPTV